MQHIKAYTRVGTFIITKENAEALYGELLNTDCGGFRVEYAKNPRVLYRDNIIVLDVKFSDLESVVEFGASPEDTSFYGRALYDIASAGVFGEVLDLREES